MICFLVTRAHRYTIDNYLHSTAQARAIAERAQVIPYEDLGGRTELPVGTYVFADLERLDGPTTRLAAAAWEQLAAAIPNPRLLNHPVRSLRRYDALRALHEAGINDFRAYRLDEIDRARFPVFLRFEHLHGGSLTGLLHNRRELDQALDQASRRGKHLEHLVVVEFAETRDPEGLYRKYGAWKIGDAVIASNIQWAQSWVVKRSSIIRDDLREYAFDHMITSPHAEWVRQVFEVAGLDYGRLDYGVDGRGRPQAWEINTNPALMRHLGHYKPILQPFVLPLIRQFAAAFDAIDEPGRTGPPVTVSLPQLPDRPRRGRVSTFTHRAVRSARRRLETRLGHR